MGETELRDLVQSKILGRAGIAGVATAAVCYLRIEQWMDRPRAAPLLGLTLLWCAFVLWAFVFAWHERYSGRRVFCPGFEPLVWFGATATGLAWAAVLHWALDPQLRTITPEDYATGWNQWIVKTLFRLGMEPLFLCFAPFAFFIRLLKKPERAVSMTVIFGLLLMYLKLSSGRMLPPFSLMVELMALRVASGFLSVYFYLKAGAPAVWWMTLLSQTRLLLDAARQ
jgi:hypothetical protein